MYSSGATDAAAPESMATCTLANPANLGLKGRRPSCSGSSSPPHRPQRRAGSKRARRQKALRNDR
eukprot:2695645-Alexandrium_andersonii.AAC.1